jgi:hypothetical protein
MVCDKLDPVPATKIKNRFKVVRGDGFHGMNRMKVPVHHTLKKSFYIALMESWYSWDPAVFDEIISKLKEKGKSEKEIESLYVFHTTLFLSCCPRIVLPPSVLYWRVRAVFAFYGPMECPHTNKPLFNTRAWKKANNLLKEILEGYYSDIPGESYYRYRTDDNGEIRKNSLEMPLIECRQGTSDTEATHRQLRVVYRN